MIVTPAFRRRGIASALVGRCLDMLAVLGVHKCHIDVLKTNDLAAGYWLARGWQIRTDIDRYSYVAPGRNNA